MGDVALVLLGGAIGVFGTLAGTILSHVLGARHAERMAERKRQEGSRSSLQGFRGELLSADERKALGEFGPKSIDLSLGNRSAIVLHDKNGHYCVTLDSLILTPSGSVAARDLRIGEEVYSSPRAHTLLETSIQQISEEIVTVLIRINGHYEVSEHHQLQLENGAAVRAKDLKMGYQLSGSSSITVSRLELIEGRSTVVAFKTSAGTYVQTRPNSDEWLVASDIDTKQ